MQLWENIKTVLNQIIIAFRDFQFKDFLDILLVIFIVYSLIKLIRETRAVQLAKGLVLVGIVYLIIRALQMQASTFIFQMVLADLVLVVIILFQPEIRNALETVGRSSLSSFNFFGGRDEQKRLNNEVRSAAIAVAKACNHMSEQKVGSLIVFEKEVLLGDVAKSGTEMDALVTQELIGNIFFPKSPLHDGAVIIRRDRIYAAGCVLPLTKNQSLSSDLGMRHRAALGMSEESDALVVVTSEETGNVSIARKGRLSRGLSEATLREELIEYMTIDPTAQREERRGKILQFFQRKSGRKKPVKSKKTTKPKKPVPPDDTGKPDQDA